MTKTIKVVIDRWLGGATSGCYGSTIYRHIDPAGGVGQFGGLSIEDVLGEALPSGTEIEVTVKIIKRGQWPKKCANPWPAHRCPKES